MAKTAIFAEQTLSGFEQVEGMTLYVFVQAGALSFVLDETYIVSWDGTEHKVTGKTVTADGLSLVCIGNESFITGENDTGEPFFIYSADDVTIMVTSDTTTDTHTVAIYQGESESTNVTNDVVIQNYSQKEVTYPSVPKVWLKSAESTEENTVLVPFSYGEAVENVPISLDFSPGEDQTVTADDGKLIKSAVIEKPVDLVAENIRCGKVIAGVEGDFVGDTEEITVSGDDDLTFAGGESFVVEPSSADKVISKVTISPPSELKAENIAKGVTIAGIEGTHEGGGGGDFSDENLKYFTYQIDGEANTITLFSILYDVIYANTGSYDVTIPDKIAGFSVVIKSE